MKKIVLFYVFLCFFGNLYAQKVKISDKIILKLRKPLEDKKNFLSQYARYSVEQMQAMFAFEKDPNLSLLYIVDFNQKQDLSGVLADLTKNPNVDYAEIYTDTWQKMSYFPDDYYVKQNLLWSHHKTRLFDAWDIEKGTSNVVIGVIDAGTDYEHPDLKNQIYINNAELNGKENVDDDKNGYIDDIRGYDFVGKDNDASMEKNSGNWHGIAVAGICSATADNKTGTAGTGFYAKYMPLKVFSLKEQYNTVAIYEAIKYAADNACQIINISLGSTSYARWQQEIIDYATLQKGVLIVASAGNDESYEGEVFYPAAYQNVLSVTASDRFDEHIGTAKNHYIDLMAPGKDMVSSISAGNLSYRTDFQGTSYAAPFVAGVAALLKSKYPYLTGLQIGEVIRQSTDPIYQISENAKFAEKLGKGRLNAYEAVRNNPLTTWQSVRLENASYQNRFGEYAFRGDTVQVRLKVRNLLKSAQNLQITLQSLSEYAQILDGFETVGQVASNLSAEVIFKIVLSSQTPASARLDFRLGYLDNNYQDYEYFFINTSPHYLNTHLNDISFTASANGRIGYADHLRSEGIGLGLDQQSWINEAGLMIALNKDKVANCVLSEIDQIDQDFELVQNVRLLENDLQSLAVESSFADKNKIGLAIQQKITAKINSPHRRYFVLEYTITNTTSQKMDSLSVGLYMDWFIGKGLNRADWDSTQKMGYVYEDGGNFAGIKVFGKEVSYFAIDKLNIGENNIQMADGFSDTEKFRALSSGIARQKAGQSPLGNDIAQVIALKIRDLQANQSQKVQFVISLANSLDELKKTTTIAENHVQQSQKSPKPVLSSTICNNNPLTIRPKNGKKFRFYAQNDLSKPIFEGEFMSVSPQQANQVFYISSVDSVLESELVKYQFSLYKPTAFFESVNTVNALDSMVVHFYQKSPNAKSWKWNFGDGSKEVSNQLQVRHVFKFLGYFTVQLTVTDSSGCENTFSKTISVVRQSQSPPPIVAAQYGVCEGDSLKIRPKNGTTFRFYRDASKKQLLFTGKEFLSNDNSLNYLYISNIDSVLESETIRTAIRWSGLKPNFKSSLAADTVLFAKVRFSYDSLSSRLPFTTVSWNFGENKSFVTALSSVYQYKKQGVYAVTMVVFDSLGCQKSISKNFVVGRKSPFPKTPNVEVCKNNPVVLKASNGTKFRFYADSERKNLLFEGNNYSFVPQKNTLIYVSNADSLVESDLRTVSVKVNEAQADFDFTPVLLRADRHRVFFRNLSQQAVRYVWNFGDGSKIDTTQSPIHYYAAQGYYQVSLSIIDKNGCQTTVKKVVEVYSESPIPQIDSILNVCPADLVEITPKNGTWFAFYSAYPSEKPNHVGQSWNIGSVNGEKTVFVVCLDSILPSKAKAVTVRISETSADFNILNDTIFEGEEVNLLATDPKALSWSWDLGNGQSQFTKQAKALYAHAGIYTVSLLITDPIGCQSLANKTLTVLPRFTEKSYSKSVIYPNPTEGDLKIGLIFGQPKTAHLEVYDALGQLILKTDLNDLLKNKVQNLRLENKGLYIFKLFLDKDVHLHKVIAH